MSKVLVTGGAGMIGSNLVKKLVDAGRDVYVIDNLSRGKKEYLIGDDGQQLVDFETRLVTDDLRTPGVIEALGLHFDEVFHLADVVAGIGYVFSNQLKIFRDNMLINSNVIDSMREMKPSAFIYVGTACSFPANLQDGSNERPLVEADQYPANPESGYGWSKLMGEYEAFLLEKEYGVPVSVLVLHNVYGTPCDFSIEKSQVIPSLINKAIRCSKGSLDVWGSGKQRRAFVHVDDVVRALLATAKKGLGKGIIQIGPDEAISIADIATLVVDISGKNIDIQFDLSKPEGDHSRCADFSKAQQILGWHPEVDIRTGLEGMFEWMQCRI